MSAEVFMHWSSGKSADAAFQSARDEAQYDYGHAGYTGTIAEKHSFVMIPWPGKGLPDRTDAEELGDKLISSDDPRIDDKWGPAGCIKAQNDEYLFFGLASS
mgnify:CR=1 FL=1